MGKTTLTGQARWLTEADVAGLVTMADSVKAVEDGLRAEAAGEAAAMDKTYVAVRPGATFQALGAASARLGLLGTKTWAQGLGTAGPVLVAFDAETGQLRAMMAATVLSRLRTGALGGVAAKVLARADATHVAVLGSGRQAETQVAAVCAVRAVKTLTVFSPTPANREAFAQRMSDALGIEARACETPAAAVEGADVVITIAKTTKPVLQAEWLAPGAHVNAVGVTIRGRRELTDGVVSEAGVICADSVSGARLLSDDLRDVLGTGDATWQRVRALGDLVAEGAARPGKAALTLYKGVGSGVADVALAAAVLTRAEAAGIGQLLDLTDEPPLRLGS